MNEEKQNEIELVKEFHKKIGRIHKPTPEELQYDYKSYCSMKQHDESETPSFEVYYNKKLKRLDKSFYTVSKLKDDFRIFKLKSKKKLTFEEYLEHRLQYLKKIFRSEKCKRSILAKRAKEKYYSNEEYRINKLNRQKVYKRETPEKQIEYRLRRQEKERNDPELHKKLNERARKRARINWKKKTEEEKQIIRERRNKQAREKYAALPEEEKVQIRQQWNEYNKDYREKNPERCYKWVKNRSKVLGTKLKYTKQEYLEHVKDRKERLENTDTSFLEEEAPLRMSVPKKERTRRLLLLAKINRQRKKDGLDKIYLRRPNNWNKYSYTDAMFILEDRFALSAKLPIDELHRRKRVYEFYGRKIKTLLNMKPSLKNIRKQLLKEIEESESKPND